MKCFHSVLSNIALQIARKKQSVLGQYKQENKRRIKITFKAQYISPNF